MTYIQNPSSIEEKSFQIIQSTITEKDPDYVFHSEMEESIIKRAIHTTGDFDYLYTMRFEHDVLKKIEEVIRAKGTILLDSNISLNGINKRVLDQLGVSYRCLISDEEVVALAKEKQITRAMAAVEIAAKIEGPKVFAFGGAPTALSYLIELAEQGLVEPDAVIGSGRLYQCRRIQRRAASVRSSCPCQCRQKRWQYDCGSHYQCHYLSAERSGDG